MLKIVKRGKGNFSLFRFSGIGCGKGCLSCGVIQKGRFCPCGECRGDGLLSSRSELRFDRAVPTHLRCQTLGFSSKISFFQKAKCFANKNTCQKGCGNCSISSTGILLSDSYSCQHFLVEILPSDNLSSYEH